MNKLANVVYSYRPKNDDELELEVGDKIEVIGIEEEGKLNIVKSFHKRVAHSKRDKHNKIC